jgi:Flp pilus assembly pilin Flp
MEGFITALVRILQRVAARFRPASAEAAQGLVEYGLILVMITIVCVGIIGILGNTVSTLWWQRIIDAFPNP